LTRRDLELFCSGELGSALDGEEFLETGVGTVLGVRLRDGRRVVVKCYRAGTEAWRLDASLTVQRHLAEQGFPAPLPLTGPVETPAGLMVAETLLDRGSRDDPNDPALRRAMAWTLAQLVALCRPFQELDGIAWSHDPAGPLWGRLHDDRFDFVATSVGAEWIDELAREARGRLGSGPVVIGHLDWRAENMRFAAGRVSAVYDWESLRRAPEPVVVGAAAHYYPSDFRVAGRRQLPTMDTALAFVGDYEQARGAEFSTAERRAARAALVDAMAYTARCEHSDALTGFGGRPPAAPGSDPPDGSARAFLRAHARDLLDG
jgi:Phosphotransferase enzyme family